MKNSSLLHEVSFERWRWGLPDYECIIMTDLSSWEEIVDLVSSVSRCTYNVQRRVIKTSDTGVIRFLDVEGITLRSLQDFSCASQNSTIILDLNKNYDKYLAGVDGVNYLRSRMRNMADCHTRFVII